MEIDREAISVTAIPSFETGRKSSITTAVQLVSTTKRASKGVTVTASTANTVPVYFGFRDTITRDSSDSTDGEPIQPGGAAFIQIDDASKIYVTAASSSKVFWRTE